MKSRRWLLGRRISSSASHTSIGRRILHAEPFDAHAEDGDGDGLVQDGTQWERPTTAPLRRAAESIADRAIAGRPGSRRTRDDRRLTVDSLRNALRSGIPLAQRDAPLQRQERPSVGGGMRVSLDQSRAMRREIEDTLRTKLGPTIYQQIGHNHRVAVEMLRRYYPNLKKIDHDFDRHSYSPHDAAQIKLLLYKAAVDKPTAKYIRELHFKLNQNLENGFVVDGSHFFSVQDGGGRLTLFRAPHEINSPLTRIYDDINYVVNSAVNEPNWFPHRSAMLELIKARDGEESTAGINAQRVMDNLEELYQIKLIGTAVHEWAHANHYRSILEQEFGIAQNDWSSTSKLKNKLFNSMSSEDKMQILRSATFYNEFAAWYDIFLTKIRNHPNFSEQEKIDIRDHAKSFIEGPNGWFTFYYYINSHIYNIDETTGIKQDLVQRLDHSFEAFNELVSKIDPDFDIRTLISEIDDKSDRIFDNLNLSSENVPDLNAFIERLKVGIGSNIPPGDWQLFAKDLNDAYKMQTLHMIAQRILDSLDTQVKQQLAQELHKVSDYSAMFENFMRSGGDAARGMEFWRLMQSKGGWNSNSPYTSLLEGVAELMTAMDHGMEPTSENLKKLVEFLSGKAETKEPKQFSITLQEYNDLSKDIDNHKEGTMFYEIGTHNWLTYNGPVTITLPPVPDFFKKQQKKKG